MKKSILVPCLLQFIVGILAVVSAAIFTPSAFAFGRGLSALQQNPYVSTLQREFNGAEKLALADFGSTDAIRGVELGRNYECRVFYALSQKNASTPAMGAMWYNFAKYGDLFVDNMASLQVGRVKTFAANPSFGSEFLGQSDDHLYYEAVRVNASGDLIIEGSTPPQVWIRSVLNFLGMGGSMPELIGNIDGLALASAVIDSGNLVVSYTYCPKDRMTARLFPSF